MSIQRFLSFTLFILLICISYICIFILNIFFRAFIYNRDVKLNIRDALNNKRTEKKLLGYLYCLISIKPEPLLAAAAKMTTAYNQCALEYTAAGKIQSMAAIEAAFHLQTGLPSPNCRTYTVFTLYIVGYAIDLS